METEGKLIFQQLYCRFFSWINVSECFRHYEIVYVEVTEM